jgi:excisionase family DNA binding protein
MAQAVIAAGECYMLSIPLSQVSTQGRAGADRVVTLGEAAAYLGCSVATIKRLHRRGEIKIVRLSPRRIGARLSDLTAFVDSRAA